MNRDVQQKRGFKITSFSNTQMRMHIRLLDQDLLVFRRLLLGPYVACANGEVSGETLCCSLNVLSLLLHVEVHMFL